MGKHGQVEQHDHMADDEEGAIKMMMKLWPKNMVVRWMMMMMMIHYCDIGPSWKHYSQTTLLVEAAWCRQAYPPERPTLWMYAEEQMYL